MSFTSRDLRNAFGLFPTGIAVVTALDKDELIGITVNSFTSVSLEPPLVSFNIAQSLRSFEIFSRLKEFNINLLMRDQHHLSTRFAQAGTDKWSNVEYHFNDSGHPVLVPNLAVFHCSRYALYEAGDHRIVIGRVDAFDTNDQGDPLVYYRGAYNHLGDPKAL